MNAFFGELEGLRQKPLPDLRDAHQRHKNYRTHPINVVGSLYEEKLIDIRDVGIEGQNYYDRLDNPPYYERIAGATDKLLARKSVAERLQGVDQRLRSRGLRLHVHDAYRPREVQRYFHDTWMPQRIRQRHAGLSDAEVIAEVEKYWAAPTTSDSSPAPHSTGGAVDVTICVAQNAEPLYMGSIFDDVTQVAHTDYFENRQGGESYSDMEARANRRLLYWVMSELGFANHPNEWWHFSWGDQMWARHFGHEAAHYGPAKIANED